MPQRSTEVSLPPRSPLPAQISNCSHLSFAGPIPPSSKPCLHVTCLPPTLGISLSPLCSLLAVHLPEPPLLLNC